MSWPQNRYPFQPPGQLGLWVKILLAATTVFGLINSLTLQDRLRSATFVITIDPSGRSSATQFSRISSPFSSVDSLFGLATIVVWLIWQHRVTTNVWAKGIPIATSPGWAIGWWFVPFVNLVMPAVAVQRVYRASAPEKHSAWLVAGWWLGWLGPVFVAFPVAASKFLSPIIHGATKANNTQLPTVIDLSSAMHSIAPWFVFVSAFQVVSALFAIMIVSGIDKAQQTMQGQAPPMLAPVPARPDLGF
jgi:Domain of unknown function (DUF4328)